MISEYPMLIPEEKLVHRTIELGHQISRNYANVVDSQDPLIVVGLLTGGFIFTADLVRSLMIPHLVILAKPNELQDTIYVEVEKRNILVVDDIYDQGLAIPTAVFHLRRMGAVSVQSCVLLSRKSSKHTHYVGFRVYTDRWLVGWGMDSALYGCNGLDRGLPYVGMLRDDPNATYVKGVTPE